MDVYIAECPFYRIKKGKAIRCEGIAKGNNICLTFRFEKSLVKYFEAHCCSMKGWTSCPIARMLIAKYK